MAHESGKDYGFAEIGDPRVGVLLCFIPAHGGRSQKSTASGGLCDLDVCIAMVELHRAHELNGVYDQNHGGLV